MSDHIYELASDYILGLLPPTTAKLVVDHLAICGSCRDTVINERKVANAVRQTVNSASRPDQMRLLAIKPEFKRNRPQHISLHQQVVVACVMVILLVGGITLTLNRNHQPSLNSQSTAYVTMTNTVDTPTATATSLSQNPEIGDYTEATDESGMLIIPAVFQRPSPAITPEAITLSIQVH